ncbi:hypothetical protein [Neptunicella sp. SCSIO 80796]|uniref:hypothetical protein n=1 Tax=Neptunicella plasticusilytica TaxID=3117012 RepID=UPI003A4E0AE3
MEIESSLVASQNALASNPPVREPQRDVEARQQQQQQKVTQLPRSQVVIRQGNTQAFEDADKFRQQQAIYDQPASKNRQAINAYQTLQREGLRSEIHQSLGVDTYV